MTPHEAAHNKAVNAAVQRLENVMDNEAWTRDKESGDWMAEVRVHDLGAVLFELERLYQLLDPPKPQA